MLNKKIDTIINQEIGKLTNELTQYLLNKFDLTIDKLYFIGIIKNSLLLIDYNKIVNINCIIKLSLNFDLLSKLLDEYIELFCNKSEFQLAILYLFSTIMNNINEYIKLLIDDDTKLENIIKDINNFTINGDDLDKLLDNNLNYKSELVTNSFKIKNKLLYIHCKIVMYIINSIQ